MLENIIGNEPEGIEDKQIRLQKLLDENQIGGVLDFGHYEGKPLQWIVLEKTNDSLLLMTEKAIIYTSYGPSGSLWRTSQIREDLNGSYFDSIFSDEEKELVGTSTISNGSDGKTDDRVYILSKREVNKYLPDKKDRVCGKDWRTREGNYMVDRGKIKESVPSGNFYLSLKYYFRPVICLKIDTEKKKPAPKGYKSIFKYSKDKNGIIISGYKGDDKHLVIPEEIDGVPVYRIKESAFKNSVRFDEVTFPKTIRIVEAGIFENCKLKAIHINDLNAWAGTFVERQLLLYSSNTKIISNGEEVTKIELNDVQLINKSAFDCFPSIREVVIGKGVKEIGYRAFYACEDLDTFSVDADDIQIDSSAIHAGKTINLNGNVNYIGCEAIWGNHVLNIKGDIEKLAYKAIYLSCIEEISCNESVLEKIFESSKTEDAAEFCIRYLLGCVNVSTGLDKVIEKYIYYHKDAVADKLQTELYLSAKKDSVDENSQKIIELKKRFSVENADTKILKTTPDSEFKYYVVDDEVILRRYLGNKENVVIPDMIDGMPVTEISNAAFYNNAVKTVAIPETVHTIGKSCFEHCSKLSHIELPEAVTVIQEKCFKGCVILKSVELPPNLRTIEYAAFEGCQILKSIELPDTLLFIDSSAFDGCVWLSEINLPEHLVTLGSMYHTKSLQKMIIPAEMIELESDHLEVKEITIGEKTSLLNYDFILRSNENLEYINCSEQQMTLLFDHLDDKAKWNIVIRSIVEENIYDVYQKYIQKNKKQLIEEIILKHDGDGLVCLLNNIKNPDIEKWIEFAQKNNKTASLALLIDYGNREGPSKKDDEFSLDRFSGNSEKEFAFTVTGSTVRIGKYKGSSENLEIPEEINGKPVTEIAERAYAENNFKSVIIPASILRIGRDAFRNCVINEVSADSLSSWMSIIFETEGSNPVSQMTAFTANQETIQTLECEEEEVNIGRYSFANMSSIQKLMIKGKKISIGEGAFTGCVNLQEIDIEGKLADLGKNSFELYCVSKVNTSCKNMETILKKASPWDKDELINHYIESNVTVNEDAAKAFEKYFSKHEKRLVDNYIEENESNLLAGLIKIHPLNKDELDEYIHLAENYADPANQQTCLDVLKEYRSSIE